MLDEDKHDPYPARYDKMTDKAEQVEQSVARNENALEALKLVLGFEQWCYDTYQRDFRFFLTLEVLVLGLVLKAIVEQPQPTTSTMFALLFSAAFGLVITLLWMSRQFREFYFSRARLHEVRRLEDLLPSEFRYFSNVQTKTRDLIASEKRRVPVFGSRLRLLPNLYSSKAFLRSLLIHQIFLMSWLAILAYLLAFGVQ